EIDRVARDYSRRARIPGFRPGKAPSRVVKQRYKDQILHDVAHDLIPQAVDSAIRERGVEPLDTPDIQDVNIEEGRARTFTPSFDTWPPFDLREYASISLPRPSARVEDEAVDKALEQLRERGARYEPVEGRGAGEGDTVLVDLERQLPGRPAESHENVSVDMGSPANPPGFDAHLVGTERGGTKGFTIHYPADHPNGELANADVSYTVTVKDVRRKALPALDDELAKDLGDFETLEALRARVREDLEHEARHESERAVRTDLMKQLAAWLPF